MNRNMTPAALLAPAISAVEAEGVRLREEFHAPHGPRGRRGSCPIDREIEKRLRIALQALFPARFCGEESAVSPGMMYFEAMSLTCFSTSAAKLRRASIRSRSSRALRSAW